MQDAIFPSDLGDATVSAAWKLYCKIDLTPENGIACTGPFDSMTNAPMLVCGTSAILYDGVVPVGIHGLPWVSEASKIRGIAEAKLNPMQEYKKG